MAKELQQLYLRWHKKTGEDMPLNIASLSLDRIRRAVELTEKGITVVIPKAVEPMVEVAADSMMQWDKHGELS